MSHFTVAVFTDGTKTVEELLAPFDENMDTPRYVKETKEQAIQRIRKEISDYATTGFYAQWKANPVEYESKCTHDAHIDYLKNEFPKKLLWTDEECYQDVIRYCDEDELDENGSITSTYNPNSKWDWYAVGGRWQGMLKAKTGLHGEGNIFQPNQREHGKYDSAKVSDIDFSPDEEIYKKSIRFWEVVVDKQELLPGEDKNDFFNYYKESYYTSRYGDKETYARLQASFGTFAVVTPDGKWYEKGKMGWWAAVSNEEMAWDEKYKERFIDNANPDWILTIVDCHI